MKKSVNLSIYYYSGTVDWKITLPLVQNARLILRQWVMDFAVLGKAERERRRQ
jgi:hypothetical protein